MSFEFDVKYEAAEMVRNTLVDAIDAVAMFNSWSNEQLENCDDEFQELVEKLLDEMPYNKKREVIEDKVQSIANDIADSIC